MPAHALHVLGVPFRAGSFHPGSEDDATAWREAGLVDHLRGFGCDVIDEGVLAIPSYLPHHLVPPIRNWPGPRIVWDLLADRLSPWLREAGRLPLLIGCDCSVVVGTAHALTRAGADTHVLYIDGDFDDAPPDAAKCQSAAALAVWLLTHDSPFCAEPPLKPSQVTVLGWTKPPACPEAGVGSVPLAEIRRHGVAETTRRMLAAIPASASILVHFDIDVLADRDFPAAYFPHTEGLTVPEAADLLAAVLRDPRVRLLEVSEYATLRDLDRRLISTLIALLAQALGPKR